MASVLQIGNQTIPATEALNRMAGYKFLPLFQRELIIDRAISIRLGIEA
ncbi:MAG: hypothetical protein DSM106950_21195 [Stigonema ocellatum SAG 48.90 = DSM 106950]|nr:hypothetical protein [Stigonema ocellatum SAG 48.90 = DSM 106950]